MLRWDGKLIVRKKTSTCSSRNHQYLQYFFLSQLKSHLRIFLLDLLSQAVQQGKHLLDMELHNTLG